MRKLFVAILVSVSLVGLALTQVDINAQSGISGKTVSLTSEVLGQDGGVDINRAKELYKAGQPLVFNSNGKLYYVLNAAGNVDAKNLIRNAGKQVTIEGNVKTSNGVSYVIATSYK